MRAKTELEIPQVTTPGNELLFLALGGSDEIGMNVNLYGCQGKWIMVDLGLTFGGSDYAGSCFRISNLSRRERMICSASS